MTVPRGFVKNAMRYERNEWRQRRVFASRYETWSRLKDQLIVDPDIVVRPGILRYMHVPRRRCLSVEAA